MKATNNKNSFKPELYKVIKSIVVLSILTLCIVAIQAQIRPKQLRKEVLQSQIPAKPAQVKQSKKSKLVAPPPPVLAPTVNPLANNGATLVFLENSETLSFDKVLNPDVQVLKGSVRFRHDNALLYCDSAYFYEKANSLDAFGNVRIVQGDTLFVYGDKLYYDGNVKLARLRHNVRMVNRKTTLTTDSLNYDRAQNLSYYYTGGKIKDELNTLTSLWGQYSPATNQALFKTNVKLVNKNFTLDSDTLQYNTRTSIANIVGPTHIIYNKETDIYSTRGWYNTKSERSMLLDKSLVVHKDGKTMVGDTIFYDKKSNFGEGFTHVILTDSVQKSTLYGDYIYYNKKNESGLATDSALMVDWSSKDTMFVHADTITTSKDSIYNRVTAFHNVRSYRVDVQSICDSLAYSSRDSVMNMYHQPVLWADNNQLSGEFIQAFVKNKKVNKVLVQRAAMAIQQEDTIHFNQLSGKEMVALMDSGELKKVDVNGNAETIYFPRDEKDSTLMGTNKTQSSFVAMYFRDKKIQRVVLTSASSGTMYPLAQLTGEDLRLKNFFWIDNQRPTSKASTFLTFPKTPRNKKEEKAADKKAKSAKTSKTTTKK